jgi:FkbM family methyltransferase
VKSRRILFGAGAVALIAVAFAFAFHHHPRVRLFALVMAGRSPVCPMANALDAAEHVRLLTEAKDRILAASREVQRDPSGYHLWETPKGRYWMPAGNDYVLPFNLAEQERKIYGTGIEAVKAGDIVLDCGANLGVYTREALDAGAALVVAIEPAPQNVECLRRNFAPEIAARKVILYPKGVWDKDDVLALQVDPENSAADSVVIRREGAHEGAKVPLTTIDKLVQELNLPRVDYIKMDIEGAEQRALAGARDTLIRFHPRLAISAYHNPADPERIPVLVQEAWSGYRMKCGYCAEANWKIRPDVLFFY